MKKMQSTAQRLYPKERRTPKSDNLPATQGMLKLVRNELKADIRGMSAEMNARFKLVDSKFKDVDARFKDVDARFDQVDANIQKVFQAVHHVAAEVSRLGFLMEEQNSRNAFVLEGLTGLAQRQDRLEGRMDAVEETVRSIGRGKVR